MALIRRDVPILFTIFRLASIALSLQVTPDSTCSALCMDDINDNGDSPASSSTSGSDIVCSDNDYSSTVTGTKFKRCIDCLQDSTAKSSNESDVSWFLYNIRYAVDWCLFGFPNNNDASTSPCLDSVSCGSLQWALEADNLSPQNMTAYDYCSADNGTFQGESLPKCIQCIQEESDSNTLANFLIALQAGCEQKPAPGNLLGIQGNLFDTSPINITSTTNTTSPTTSSHHLSEPAKLGLAIGLSIGLTLLLTLALYLLITKHKQNQKPITSNYHARFGSKDISAPTSGAYSSGQVPSYSIPLSNIRATPIHPAYIPDTGKMLTPRNGDGRYLRVEPMLGRRREKSEVESPESQRSVEQWPGSF